MTQKKTSDLGLVGRLLKEAMPFSGLFFVSLLLILLLAPVNSIRPYLISRMVDDHIISGILDGIQFWVGIYVVVTLLNVTFRYCFIYFSNLLGQSVIRNMRVKVYNKITNFPLSYFDVTPVGTNTTRTVNDIETVNAVYTQGLINMAADIISIFAVLGVMFYTSWKLTMIFFIMLPLLLIVTYIFKVYVRRAYEKVRSQITTMNAFLQERISGMRIVQLFNAEDQEMAKFKDINRKYTSANLNSIMAYAVFYPVVELISSMAFALMIWWGTKGFWGDTITFGALVAFPLYLTMLFRPVMQLADKLNTVQMGLVAAGRVYGILDDQRSILNHGKHAPDNVEGDIAFKNVWFSYLEGEPVLKDITIDLKAGETLAIVGSTGSGKTTIINLLNRFYDIDSGEILLDDVCISKYELSSLRDKFATVLQDVFLFRGSIYENITLRDDSVSLETVEKAAKLIGAHELLSQNSEGYNFEVMERGANLSMGQRQLISFVRALVKNPDILILDEATSSIDPETEQIIQYAIEQLIKKSTSIIIAHRLSTIRHADHVLVLDKGQVAEYGTHDSLLKIADGKYSQLYEMQFAEKAVQT